jgi:uncharacterized membrane protein
MSVTLRILPALAFAIALSPLAAQAHSVGAAPQTVRISPITPSSSSIDHPTTVYGGVGANSFPDSFGG